MLLWSLVTNSTQLLTTKLARYFIHFVTDIICWLSAYLFWSLLIHFTSLVVNFEIKNVKLFLGHTHSCLLYVFYNIHTYKEYYINLCFLLHLTPHGDKIFMINHSQNKEEVTFTNFTDFYADWLSYKPTDRVTQISQILVKLCLWTYV